MPNKSERNQISHYTDEMQPKLQSLIQFCSSNGRVCPQPQKWNELWEMLPDKTRDGLGWNPPLPLILAAWWEASSDEKRKRLQQDIIYADQKGLLGQVDQFLRDLTEEQWYKDTE